MDKESWHSTLESGVSELDGDNRSLLDLVGRVKEASEETSLGELKSALLGFQAEMLAHFEREERLMAECGYEAVETHRADHQRLAAEVEEQVRWVEDSMTKVASIGRFMNNWIVQHIADKDVLFGQAIVTQSGTTDRRQETDDDYDIFAERRLGNFETIRWTSEIAVGVESIDADHRTMIDLLNEIVVARKTTDREHLAELLEQFGNATEKHFRNEEGLIHEFDPEHAAAHAEEHRKLLDEYAQQVEDWQGNRVSAELLCRFMYRWILHHISDSDIPLGAAIFRQKNDGE